MKSFSGVALIMFLLLVAGSSWAEEHSWVDDNRLYSILWYSTSPEREAICQQTFAMAMGAIARKMSQVPSPKRPAIVIEIDEVLLDSTGYVTFLLMNGDGYTNESWDEWVRFQALKDVPVQIVPGSLEFLSEVESRGIQVLYVSDRQSKHFDETYRTLRDLGVNKDNLKERILLTRGTDWNIVDNANKKYARLTRVQKDYEILVWLGAQVEDFPVKVSPQASEGQAMVEERRAAFLRLKERLGKDFFLFPNPIWGTWLNSLGDLDNSDDLLDDFGFDKFFRTRKK